MTAGATMPRASSAAPVLWTGAKIASATGGEGPTDWQAYGVAIDSREVEPGDLFIALPGARHDGHAFAGQARERGAVAVLARHDAVLPAANGPILRVKDTQKALEALGAAARARTGARIIGVTGSAGKTGTKDALHRCLSRLGPTHASVKSFNNAIGVPLTLARMMPGVDYGVFELGMNHAGELAALARQVRPQVAVITTVGAAHQEFFASEEAIADAKAEIFAGLKAPGIAVINRDNRHYARLAAAAGQAGVARVISFGLEPGADVVAERVALHEDMSCVAADIMGEKLIFKIGVPGRHWVMNALAVLAAVRALDGDLGLAGLALAEVRALPGRGQRLPARLGCGEILVIDDAYNANPASMRAALEGLGQTTPKGRGRRLAVLGDMKELGAASPAAHAALAQPVRAAGVAHVIAVGPQMRHLAEALGGETAHLCLADAAAAREALKDLLRPGDVVLVKGSHSMGLADLVAWLAAGVHQPVRPGAREGRG
ncbi:MAG: UDP-N-acetylmuramoyl-tripeptide--D-alanyl-D-alanine ligase [Pseudomonadota bacterium]